MSDRFRPITMEALVDWVFSELEQAGSILGVPTTLVFRPETPDPLASRLYRRHLATPFGVAAGPHTQLAQNIVLAWLAGARVIELKTVQVLDELTVPKPCIAMPDEGANVEWSQELAIDESIDEYVRAWVLVHALHRVLGLAGEPGVLFNLSVGYDLKGVKSDKICRFIATLKDAGELVARHLAAVARRRPDLADLAVPAEVADSVTLSTMHGCPPDEIGRISEHLMAAWGLHTSVKLNPTLLGAAEVDHILHDRLGWHHLRVPASAYEHDIDMAAAVDLVNQLEGSARRHGVDFGVKLTNTLEVENSGLFAASERTMYLSGRPLHPLTVHVAHRLAETFPDGLLMSFSGGADAFNSPSLLAGGLATVTSCSDLLRPGGVTRLLQYVDETRRAMAAVGAHDLAAFVVGCDRVARAASIESDRPTADEVRLAARRNLARYASEVLDDPALNRDRFERHHTKTARRLGLFDCIEAPCSDGCPTDQAVPAYLRAVHQGDMARALEVTRRDNALPTVLGHACTHPCEPVCLRTHYDEPLAIRELKRFIMAHEQRPPGPPPAPAAPPARVAVVGGGPCGLGAATFLARAGLAVTVLESHPYSGGMVSGTIPVYRTSHAVWEQDLAAVTALGVEIRHGVSLGSDLTLADLRGQGFAFVVIAAGAQESTPLGVPDEAGPGVLNGLAFLRQAKHATAPALGGRVLVVGGGDVAMDCARTARRFGAVVTVLYRRTRTEMPASREEVEDLLAEGAELVELVAPVAVERADDGRLVALTCVRMELGEADASGRRRPRPIAGSEHRRSADTVLLAIGQRPRLDFLAGEGVELDRGGYLVVDPDTLETSMPGVFAGGDAIPGGAQTIVRAAGDGRRIAAEIVRRLTGASQAPPPPLPPADRAELLRRRARREWRVSVPRLAPEERTGFAEVVHTLSAEDARREAARCLDCDLMCSTCEGVCPNHAIVTYRCRPASSSGPRQELQVAVLADLCNECGNCETFCPTAGAPYRDKPRLYLHEGDFAAEHDNAFRLLRGAAGWALEGRFAGVLHRLEHRDGRLSYRVADSVVAVDPATLAPTDPPAGLDPAPCVTLAALLLALESGAPGLPAAAL